MSRTHHGNVLNSVTLEEHDGELNVKKVGFLALAYKSFPSNASGFTFHCLAKPGSASNASVWQVSREIKLTGTLEWADGDGEFDNELSDVTTLSYS